MKFETIDEMLLKVVKRFKEIRKMKNISQLELSKMSNVSYGSIKRFETTGEISLHSLAKLCRALDIEEDIDNLFNNVSFANIEEAFRYGK